MAVFGDKLGQTQPAISHSCWLGIGGHGSPSGTAGLAAPALGKADEEKYPEPGGLHRGFGGIASVMPNCRLQPPSPFSWCHGKDWAGHQERRCQQTCATGAGREHRVNRVSLCPAAAFLVVSKFSEGWGPFQGTRDLPLSMLIMEEGHTDGVGTH